jgi:hypothetical protein
MITRALVCFGLQVETFVDSDTVPGAVRSSMAGVGRRKSIQKVRSNLMAKVCGAVNWWLQLQLHQCHQQC